MHNIRVSTLFEPESPPGTAQNRTADVVKSSFFLDNHNMYQTRRFPTIAARFQTASTSNYGNC